MNITGAFRPSIVKRHLNVTLGKMLQPVRRSDADALLPYARAANIDWSGLDASDIKQMWFSLDEQKKYSLQQGDMVVLEGGDVGRSAIVAEINGFLGFQNSVHRVRPKLGNDIRFAHYWMQHLKSCGYFEMVCSRATLAHFTAEKFAVAPYPSVGEKIQNLIADFLDEQTDRIDQLIAKKKRLIELLEEKTQSLITRAALRGLGEASLGPSGVPWVKELPVTWSTPPLRALGVGNGCLFTDGDWIESKDLSEAGIRYITTGNVGVGRYKEQGTGFISEEKFDELRCTELLPGDILISRLNLPVGRACVAPSLASRVVTSVDNVILRPPASYDRRYLVYVMSSSPYLEYTRILARGTTMQRISRSELGRIRVIRPPTEEQVAIADYLDVETGKNLRISSLLERSLALLQEYRASLITAAVTGQIDVTTWSGSRSAAVVSERLEELA